MTTGQAMCPLQGNAIVQFTHVDLFLQGLNRRFDPGFSQGLGNGQRTLRCFMSHANIYPKFWNLSEDSVKIIASFLFIVPNDIGDYLNLSSKDWIMSFEK